MITRGSDRSAMSFLCRNAPYSGLSTEEVRTLQRCVAMVGGVIKAGHIKIDVEISSVGHVPVIFSSLISHFPEADWVLSMTNEMSMKCSSSYMSHIATDRRVGSHLIRYVPYQMKSHSLKKKEGNDEMVKVALKNYNADSTKWRPNVEYSGYTVYTTLFGYYPWAAKGDTTTEANATTDRSYVPRFAPPIPHFVYKFGQTESFCGIVSTVESLNLWGMDVTPQQKKTTQGRVTILSFSESLVKLTCVKTETDWYRKVIESNAAMEAYWMHAKRKYSAISNVLRIPKHGVSVVYDTLGDMVIEEQGHYVDVTSQADDDKVGVDQAFAKYEIDNSGDDVYWRDQEEDSESDEEEEDEDEDNPQDDEGGADQPTQMEMETMIAQMPRSLAKIQEAKREAVNTAFSSSSTSSAPAVVPPRPIPPPQKNKIRKVRKDMEEDEEVVPVVIGPDDM